MWRTSQTWMNSVLQIDYPPLAVDVSCNVLGISHAKMKIRSSKSSWSRRWSTVEGHSHQQLYRYNVTILQTWTNDEEEEEWHDIVATTCCMYMVLVKSDEKEKEWTSDMCPNKSQFKRCLPILATLLCLTTFFIFVLSAHNWKLGYPLQYDLKLTGNQICKSLLINTKT